jgi:hypothetical protein
MWTSSLECSNNKNSGVVVALARPTVTQEKLTMTFLQNVVGMCYNVPQEMAQGIKTGNSQRVAHGATVIIILYYM